MRTVMTGLFGVIIGAGLVAGTGVAAVARASVQTLIARYRKTFEQESVLWDTVRVVAAS